ncbi:MAG: PAAR-like domain-containing protein [Polyangiaceae bacterium]
MIPASTKAGGVLNGVPDICLTPAPPGPPVPMPYPIIGQLPQANGVVTKVVIENKETCVEGSKLPKVDGDQSGTNGGVVSGQNMAEAAAKTFSSKVTFDGKKVVFQTSVFGMNGSNANMPGGMQVAPSQSKVLVGP